MPLYSLSSGTEAIRSSVGLSKNLTVGVAAAQLVAADSTRLGLIIQNTSNRTIFIGFNAQLTLTSYAIAIEKGLAYEFPVAFQGEIFAITTSANQPIIIIEFL